MPFFCLVAWCSSLVDHADTNRLL